MTNAPPADSGIQVYDYFIIPSEHPGGKTYRVVCFSTFRGSYLDGYTTITYEEPDGCAWSMSMYAFRRQGYRVVPAPEGKEER